MKRLFGIRFASVGIPQGATILEAHIDLVVNDSTSGATSLTLSRRA